MNTDMKDRKVLLSMLWIFVMFNMIYGDILTFMVPEFLEGIMAGYAGGGEQITQGGLLVGAIIAEIPIAMVLLSRVLKYRANRWANIIAGAIKIVLVWAGVPNPPLHYIFFAAVESHKVIPVKVS